MRERGEGGPQGGRERGKVGESKGETGEGERGRGRGRGRERWSRE